MLADWKAKEEAVAVHSLIIANRSKFVALTAADLQAKQEEIENIVDANHELAETGHNLQKKAFDYLKKPLSSALVVEWQLTVEEQGVGMNYISLTGTTLGLTRGRDFTPQYSCYFRFVKLVTPQDTAEWIRRYMTTNMMLNTKNGITIEMGVGCVIEMNDALPYLSW